MRSRHIWPGLCAIGMTAEAAGHFGNHNLAVGTTKSEELRESPSGNSQSWRYKPWIPQARFDSVGYIVVRVTLVVLLKLQSVWTAIICTDNFSLPYPNPPLFPELQTIHIMSNSTKIMTAPWKRLIRFRDDNDFEHYGEPRIDDSEDLLAKLNNDLEAEVLEGDNLFEVKSTGRIVPVKEIVNLLQGKDVPTVRCIGLNYKTHSRHKCHILNANKLM
jgi:hypothetical protein